MNTGIDSVELRPNYKDQNNEATIDIYTGKRKMQKNQSSQDPYFKDVLYKRQTVIADAHTWIDSFKALLIRL